MPCAPTIVSSLEKISVSYLFKREKQALTHRFKKMKKAGNLIVGSTSHKH